MPGLMHFVSLQGPAGVELHYSEFVQRAVVRYPEWTQSWLNPKKTIHPSLQADLSTSHTHTILGKYRWGVKLPSKPEWIRSWHCGRALSHAKTDILMIWNRTARAHFVLDAMGEENCIHWEHGSAWHPGREAERERYFNRIPLAIVNSNASARVMKLLWGYSGETRICLNALRPSLTPREPIQKQHPSNRAIRLGVAARLMPVKGIALVLHATAMLKQESADVELHIAGAGVERERLRALAKNLGIASVTQFHGAVRDMEHFYRSIDCLVHAPLTEAFGLVAIEAGVHGCPAIVAAVDGLPEAVKDEVSGHYITPTLALTEYAELAGASDGIPECVYDPVEDVLCTPKAADPTALAEAVRKLFSDAESYERISRSASEHVLEERRFDRHVDQVMNVVNGVLAR